MSTHGRPSGEPFVELEALSLSLQASPSISFVLSLSGCLAKKKYKNLNDLVGHIREFADSFRGALDRGCRVIWRETNANHFDTDDGYWHPGLQAGQDRKEARCVPHDGINRTAAYARFNGPVVEAARDVGMTSSTSGRGPSSCRRSAT